MALQTGEPRTPAEKTTTHTGIRRKPGARLDLHDPHFRHEAWLSLQALDGLGLCRAPGARPSRHRWAEDHTCLHRRHRPADRRPGVTAPRWRRAETAPNSEPVASTGRYRAGHRTSSDRNTGSHPAGNDDRLWRPIPQPTAHSALAMGTVRRRPITCWPPRRCRCGRSRPWRSTSMAAARRCVGQGHHPGVDRQDRHRRRPACHRITGAAPSNRCPWKAG